MRALLEALSIARHDLDEVKKDNLSIRFLLADAELKLRETRDLNDLERENEQLKFVIATKEASLSFARRERDEANSRAAAAQQGRAAAAQRAAAAVTAALRAVQ